MDQFDRIIKETAEAKAKQDAQTQAKLDAASQARRDESERKQKLLANEVEPQLRNMSQRLSVANLSNFLNLDANFPTMMKSVTIGQKQVQGSRKVGIMVVPSDDDQVSILVEGNQNRFKKELTAKSGQIEQALTDAFEIAMKMWRQLDGFR